MRLMKTVVPASMQHEIVKLQNDLEAAGKDLTQAKTHETELTRELESLKEQLAKVQESASTTQTELEHAQKALADQADKLKTLSSSEDNSDLLHSELDRSLAEIEELKLALSRTQEDSATEINWTREQHKKELQSLTEKYVTRENTLKKEMERLAIARPKEVGEEIHKEIDDGKKELQDKIDFLNSQVKELSNQSKDNEHQVSDVLQPLKDQVDMLKLQVGILEKDNDKKDEEMRELHIANTKKISELEAEHRREMEKLKENKLALESQLADLQQQQSR